MSFDPFLMPNGSKFQTFVDLFKLKKIDYFVCLSTKIAKINFYDFELLLEPKNAIFGLFKPKIFKTF